MDNLSKSFASEAEEDWTKVINNNATGNTTANNNNNNNNRANLKSSQTKAQKLKK